MKRLTTSSYKNLAVGHGNITYAVAETDADIANISNDGSDAFVKQCNQNGEVYIISYSGHDTEIAIPALIEGFPVTSIAKKAFLSNKYVREIVLPETLVEIGDWAFARCDRLKRIGIPYRSLKLGQDILLDCVSLEQIIDVLSDSNDKKTIDVSYLLAASVGILDAFYLFDLQNAGSDEWFRQWDVRMKNIMEMDDSEGFSKMLLCGEEDYEGSNNDPENYKHLKRMSKIRVAMLRLMHDYKLDDDISEGLKKYLLMHIKGCKHQETWDVVLNEHGDNKAYYEFLTLLGAVNENNLQEMLLDMGDRHTEMKAFLMKYNDKMTAGADPFSKFEL